MKVDLFDFDLPADRIATHPAEPRDAARLLVVGEALQDRRVRDLPSLLRRGDLLVVNDTRVIPARLTGESGGGRVEITLVREREPGLWIALARPARRLKPGVRVVFASDFAAEAVGRGGAGEVLLRFPVTGPAFQELLARHGAVPLPPYIKRPAGVEARDAEDYQTLFAREPGAIAAPTAGLHFTSELLERLRAAGVGQAAVTLHVGPGTFLPVRVDDTDDHRMHAEWGTVTAGSARAIADTRAAGGRVVAVGTTSLRLLETAAAAGGGVVAPFAGTCDLFIVPGYRFRAVDLLMTNFHLPRSTLFMLVAAFAGLERTKAAYEHAKRAGYRFYSYGDATLLEPPSGR